MNSAGSELGAVVGFCKCFNESSDSIKEVEVAELPIKYQLPKLRLLLTISYV
jgi:hypothetical protein